MKRLMLGIVACFAVAAFGEFGYLAETNKVLEKGGELVVFVRSDTTFDLGRTETVQDFKTYRLRDIGRPRRNAKRGMLPPKLARMMINIASPKHNDTILDPFCGSGTIIHEAFLLGYKNIIGSDISEKAVRDRQHFPCGFVRSVPYQPR